jgi:hypothetical protein
MRWGAGEGNRREWERVGGGESGSGTKEVTEGRGFEERADTQCLCARFQEKTEGERLECALERLCCTLKVICTPNLRKGVR